jgi:hypothetical protein
MKNYLNPEIDFGQFTKTDISKLMRCYSGGSSNGSSNNSSSGSGSGNSVSQSTTNTNLTTQQLLDLYSKNLSPVANATNTVAGNTTAGKASTQAVNSAAAADNAINLNGLSPGESNAVERATNQGNAVTGNLGNNNATNTVANAMNFGTAYDNKITAKENAANTLSSASNAANNTTSTTASLFSPFATNANSSNTKSTSNSKYSSASSGTGNGSQSSWNVGGCFLTTACCEYKGLPDDCEELTVLRKFRDECVPKKLVERYYVIAPNICVKIQGNDSALKYVYNVIQECVNDIKLNRRDCALDKYVGMVEFLQQEVS